MSELIAQRQHKIVDVFSEHINGTLETNIHHGKNEGSIVFPMLWSDHVK